MKSESNIHGSMLSNTVVFPPRTGWDGFIWVYLSSILLSCLIRKNKVQPRQRRANGVRPRPLTSTGCCFWISSWWGGCLPARWWCHKAAFSAPKQHVTQKLVNLRTSASLFHLDFLIICFLYIKKKRAAPAGFRLQGWGPGRRRRTGPGAPRTSSWAGPARCRTGSSLVGIWVLGRKETKDEEQI